MVADSAEPKSIDEIASYGISILPSQKVQGSVNQGIQYVQDKQISVTERSRNILLEEMQNLGPMRMREVQEAQNRIVEAAKQLAEDGQIVLPQGSDDDQVID